MLSANVYCGETGNDLYRPNAVGRLAKKQLFNFGYGPLAAVSGLFDVYDMAGLEPERHAGSDGVCAARVIVQCPKVPIPV